MQPSDAGVYTCQVHNFPDVDGKSEVNINVNVLGKYYQYEKKKTALTLVGVKWNVCWWGALQIGYILKDCEFLLQVE